METRKQESKGITCANHQQKSRDLGLDATDQLAYDNAGINEDKPRRHVPAAVGQAGDYIALAAGWTEH